jgi:hypothetical protein
MRVIAEDFNRRGVRHFARESAALATRWMRALAAVAILIACHSGAHAQSPEAGRIQFVNGLVHIIAGDRQSRPAVKGAVVRESETIATDPGAVAQVVMTDGGIIAVRPDTLLLVQTFRFQGKEDGTEASTLSLLKGGFRTLTGFIGRRNRDTYRVLTTTATIGIRGTDHEVHVVAPPQAGETPVAPPGTYNRVNSGETFVTTALGTAFVAANQVGFAPLNAAPQILKVPPAFLQRAAPMPTGKAELRLEQFRMVSALDAARDALAGQRFLEDRGRLLFKNVVREQYCRDSIDCTVVQGPVANAQSAGAIEVPAGVAGVGGDFAMSGAFDQGATAIDGSVSRGFVDKAGNLVAISDRSGFLYGRADAKLVDAGEADANGTKIRWGIYDGGAIFSPEEGARVPKFFHYMLAANYSTPAELSVPGVAAMYKVVGFTKPIDEQARVGGSVTLSVGLQFGTTPRILSYNLGVTDAGGRAWTGTLTGPQTLASFSSSGTTPNLSVTCSGACAPSGSGSASGVVIGGANRDGMISSYVLNAGSAGVTGSVAVKK